MKKEQILVATIVNLCQALPSRKGQIILHRNPLLFHLVSYLCLLASSLTLTSGGTEEQEEDRYIAIIFTLECSKFAHIQVAGIEYQVNA
jgi:hypothetical protein